MLLLALSQLSACAVMSKQECLNADWRQVGYNIGNTGNIDISESFNLRESTCAKHGATANWRQFKRGHADGVVQFCQLDNAVELGVGGVSRVIDDQVCSERDYPGFREAFQAGYKLHVLRSRVRQSNATIANLNDRAYRYEKDIRRINRELGSEELDLDKSEREYLGREHRELRRHLYRLEDEIEQCRKRLYHQQSEANNYSDYVYQDYLLSLSNEFVDPRNSKRSASQFKRTEKSTQSEFEDRVDDVLNE